MELPGNSSDEKALLLGWLRVLRGAVLRNLDGLDDDGGRWTPGGALLPVVGVVNHLTHVEWRWIDGGFLGAETSRSEEEFRPADLTVADAVRAYRERERATEAAVRDLALTAPCALEDGLDLRWVLLHLVNETARHCGHADATRELLDGARGE